MGMWEKSVMTTAYLDSTETDINEDCEVRIDEKTIVVSYHDDGPVIYKGGNDGTGHFELRCVERGGHASLHMFKNGRILEGYWIEGHEEGF